MSLSFSTIPLPGLILRGHHNAPNRAQKDCTRQLADTKSFVRQLSKGIIDLIRSACDFEDQRVVDLWDEALCSIKTYRTKWISELHSHMGEVSELGSDPFDWSHPIDFGYNVNRPLTFKIIFDSLTANINRLDKLIGHGEKKIKIYKKTQLAHKVQPGYVSRRPVGEIVLNAILEATRPKQLGKLRSERDMEPLRNWLRSPPKVATGEGEKHPIYVGDCLCIAALWTGNALVTGSTLSEYPRNQKPVFPRLLESGIADLDVS